MDQRRVVHWVVQMVGAMAVQLGEKKVDWKAAWKVEKTADQMAAWLG